jgi:hypothetical protein
MQVVILFISFFSVAADKSDAGALRVRIHDLDAATGNFDTAKLERKASDVGSYFSYAE